jgi:two-component system chemotaxis sensor kinase CheA
MDMSRYLGLFVAEATEHLEALGRELLDLEGTPPPGRVDSLFRHAHSVKGMAASMGYEPITALSHQVEDVLGLLREKPQPLGKAGLDLLLQATDVMLGMVRRTQAKEPLAPADELGAQLGALHRRLQRGEAPPAQEERPRPQPPLPVPRPSLPEAAMVRVRTEVLDQLLDGAGEVLLAAAQLRELLRIAPEPLRTQLEEGLDLLHARARELHGRVMGARMTPLTLLTDRLPRAFHDLLRRAGKEADLTLSGTELELDRALIDALGEPVLHLLRNCVDHGIEPAPERLARGKPPRGKVTLSARRDRDRAWLRIEDDGRGMDPDRLRAAAVERGLITAEEALALDRSQSLLLACLPGVSTAKTVSDLSGRGVGMDAVQLAVEQVGGTMEISSELGRGTAFTLRLPLSVSIVHVLLVGVGNEIVGVPLLQILSALERVPADQHEVEGQLLDAVSLADLLRLPAAAAVDGPRPHLQVEGRKGPLLLRVDRLIGHAEVVLKPLPRPLEAIPGLAGVTLLGNERPVVILDVPRLG